jgi:hypothetical protein
MEITVRRFTAIKIGQLGNRQDRAHAFQNLPVVAIPAAMVDTIGGLRNAATEG